ncbi:MAG: hypothetical protein QMD23_00655, partial [Candidatus Bathyarchaeia archaeon]|nr:hypothetical protein [Candidatus Bathyarchaeia archaeon]
MHHPAKMKAATKLLYLTEKWTRQQIKRLTMAKINLKKQQKRLTQIEKIKEEYLYITTLIKITHIFTNKLFAVLTKLYHLRLRKNIKPSFS